MSNDINKQALLAKNEAPVRENLIKSQRTAILRTASLVSRKFINESDDEWSVALYAFSEAIDRYNEDAGDFLPFARMRIKQALIDEFRSKKRFDNEDPDDGTVLNIVRDENQEISRNIRDEIFSANEMLQEFGFRFMDLTEASPKQDRSKRECALAVRVMLSDKTAVSRLKTSKQLDLKWLHSSSGVSQKVLERYRRYIIMASLILSEDYPCISKYLKYIKEVQ